MESGEVKYFDLSTVKELLKIQRKLCKKEYEYYLSFKDKECAPRNIESAPEPKLAPSIDILPSDRQLIKSYHLGWRHCLENRAATDTIVRTKTEILKEVRKEIE